MKEQFDQRRGRLPDAAWIVLFSMEKHWERLTVSWIIPNCLWTITKPNGSCARLFWGVRKETHNMRFFQTRQYTHCLGRSRGSKDETG